MTETLQSDTAGQADRIDRDLEAALLDAMPDSEAVRAILAAIELDGGDLTALRRVVTTLREVRIRAGHLYGETSWGARKELDNQSHRFFWRATQHLKHIPPPQDAPWSQSYIEEWGRVYGWLSAAALETLLARPRKVSLPYLRFVTREYRLGRVTLADLEAGP